MSFIVSKDTTTLKKYVPDDSDTFPFESVVCDVTVPGTFTTIGKEAFYEAYNVRSVIIEEGVTSIADWTFYGCNSINSITVPESVKYIGKYAFLSHYDETEKYNAQDNIEINHIYITDISTWIGRDYINTTSNPFCNSKNI